MAGIFGFFDYSKPGPGVPKDAPPKPRIVVFFEVFSRKFWNLVKLNLLFTVFNLPAIFTFAALVFLSTIIFPESGSISSMQNFVIRFAIGSLLLCVPMVTVGPAQAGFTYVLRNYAREEHAFIWSDFKEHALKNLKQSIVISAIDFFVTIVIAFDINLYSKMQGGGMLVTVASAFLILSFVIYLMMHMYIYPMLVTFDLSIKQIFKNALIFSIIKFFPNLGILLICAFIAIISFISPVIGVLLFPVITVSLIGFISNFYVYPVIKKYMMDNKEKQNDEA